MIGIIAEIIISWILLHYFEKSNLSVLGIKPNKNRIINFLVGFLLAAGICTVYNVSSKVLANNKWILNTSISIQNIVPSFLWVIKSVVFEELIFRGALLYIIIKKWGTLKACYFSAICFGIYHWFSYGAFGNPAQMAIIFFMTGIFGLMLAFAFAKTKSLYLPIALHLGWNIFNIIFFSNGPLGAQIFIKANENKPEGILSLILFLFQIFALPLLVYGYFKIISNRKVK